MYFQLHIRQRCLDFKILYSLRAESWRRLTRYSCVCVCVYMHVYMCTCKHVRLCPQLLIAQCHILTQLCEITWFACKCTLYINSGARMPPPTLHPLPPFSLLTCCHITFVPVSAANFHWPCPITTPTTQTKPFHYMQCIMLFPLSAHRPFRGARRPR